MVGEPQSCTHGCDLQWPDNGPIDPSRVFQRGVSHPQSSAGRWGFNGTSLFYICSGVICLRLGNCSFVLLVPQMLWCILIWVCQQVFCFNTYKRDTKNKPRSMGSTLRTKSNPLGRADSQAVRDGNLLCARALILMLIASAKGVFWCLEQPSSSTMEYHPVFQMLLRLVTVRRVIFKMSQFGGPTPKRTILYSSDLVNIAFNCLENLERFGGVFACIYCKYGVYIF